MIRKNGWKKRIEKGKNRISYVFSSKQNLSDTCVKNTLCKRILNKKLKLEIIY
jgi:hypothetical protein